MGHPRLVAAAMRWATIAVGEGMIIFTQFSTTLELSNSNMS
jgi:hypothetical protein